MTVFGMDIVMPIILVDLVAKTKVIVFFPMGYYADWIGSDATTIIEAVIILVISYFFIWLFCYIGWKKEINAINRNLESGLGKQFSDK